MGPMFVGVVENKMILLFGEIILFDYFWGLLLWR